MRIYHRVCFWQDLTAILIPYHLMVICHNDCHAQLFGQTHLLQGRNAVVAGDNGIDSVFLRLADNRFVDAIAIPDALRDLVIHGCTAPGQAAIQKIGGAHSVNIVIANNPDTDTRPDFFKDQGRCLIHIFHEMRIIKLVQGTV